jgi:spore coat protein A
LEGEPPNPETTGQIMQFRVTETPKGPDPSLPPTSIPLSACADLRPLVTTALLKNPRRAFLNVLQGPHGPSMLTLSNLRWTDPITETPRMGSVEVWEIMNLANDLHPIHLHLIQCQLLNRQAFDVKAYKKNAAVTLYRRDKGELSQEVIFS